MARNPRDDAPREEDVEPLYWMKSPETGNVYPAHTELARGDYEARGYGFTSKPGAKHENVTPPTPPAGV